MFAPRQRGDRGLMLRVLERPEQTNRQRFNSGGDKFVDRLFGRGEIERHHHLAEAVDALGHATDKARGNHGRGTLDVLEIGECAFVQADPARAHPADNQGVFETARHDQAGLGASALNHRIGSDGRSVEEHRALAQHGPKIESRARSRGPDRRNDAFCRIVGRRGRLADRQLARSVENNGVDERASGIGRHDVAGVFADAIGRRRAPGHRHPRVVSIRFCSVSDAERM